ncbi:MAG TPA: hypothetical protein VND91_06790 [Candidatus Saccharimonadia bacterium]|nr:hypothetical protein [Candidatus Saccharimonadia bacterium]
MRHQLKTLAATTTLALSFANVVDAGPAVLRTRCLAAIDAGGVAVDRATLKETMSVPIGEHSHLYQFTAADGGVFSCQLCDDANPAAACPTLGIDLAYRPAAGELRRLPAELDRKCLDDLQRNLGTPEQRLTIKYDLVQRTAVTPAHTDSRYVFKMALDGGEYRCVIRKSDGSFRVERHEGETWRPLAGGIYY